MKKFFVALFLIVGVITVHLFVSEIIYLQIADLLWLFVYGIGLSKIDEREFVDKRNRLRLGKMFRNGILFRLVPLIVYAGTVAATLFSVEFLFSLLMFLLVAVLFTRSLFSDLFGCIKGDD